MPPMLFCFVLLYSVLFRYAAPGRAHLSSAPPPPPTPPEGTQAPAALPRAVAGREGVGPGRGLRREGARSARWGRGLWREGGVWGGVYEQEGRGLCDSRAAFIVVLGL